MEWGIKISKSGTDVNTAGTNNLLMDSTYPILKIKQSGSGTLSLSSGVGDSDTITHNLGFIPKVLVYGEFYDISTDSVTPGYWRYPSDEGRLFDAYTYATYITTTTELIISSEYTDWVDNSVDIHYFYYIFYDEEG